MTIVEAAKKAAEEKMGMYRKTIFHDGNGVIGIMPNVESNLGIDTFECRDGKVIINSRRRWFAPTADDVMADDWEVMPI